jgi:hypothetical protein
VSGGDSSTCILPYYRIRNVYGSLPCGEPFIGELRHHVELYHLIHPSMLQHVHTYLPGGEPFIRELRDHVERVAHGKKDNTYR